jgi:hypothetical protein
MVLMGLASACLAGAQSNINHYFQLRDMSGLSGSEFGVTYLGVPSIWGAMAFSTPIGFSLGSGVFDVGANSKSRDNLPRPINFHEGANNKSDGTAQFMAGLGTPIGNFTGTLEVVSSAFDQVYNGQWQLPLHLKNAGVSVGCQNITDRHESAPGFTGTNRSYFGVGTYQFAHGDYISLGVGSARFKGGFGSICGMITPRLKGLVEYDTFGYNPGLGYSFGKVKGLGNDYDHNDVVLFLGFVKSQYATVGLNWAF